MSSWRTNKLLEVLEKNNNSKEISDEIYKIKNEWNSSAISPGTKFMNKLSLKISNKPKNEQKYKYIKSILSDSLDNGEGEYKIFNYITSNNLNENKNNVIYGLDADLIMLSLLKSNNIYLLRKTYVFRTR